MEVRPGEYAVKRPTNPRTKAFHRYQKWLLNELVDEIWFWSGHARDEGWLAEAVQTVAKIDPDTLCIKVPDRLEREFLLTTKPDIYYMADHYANFECVLIRMSKADREELRNLFEDAWRAYAPKRLVATYPSATKIE